jgi:hypothetical protein
MSERAKISEQHRRRRAVVYVRQSTLAQVATNVESAARQYRLVERAVELGWPREAVAVVDEDTGRSGSSSEGRIGFKELAASVGLARSGSSSRSRCRGLPAPRPTGIGCSISARSRAR